MNPDQVDAVRIAALESLSRGARYSFAGDTGLKVGATARRVPRAAIGGPLLDDPDDLVAVLPSLRGASGMPARFAFRLLGGVKKVRGVNKIAKVKQISFNHIPVHSAANERYVRRDSVDHKSTRPKDDSMPSEKELVEFLEENA